jgi:hypothetical protein
MSWTARWIRRAGVACWLGSALVILFMFGFYVPSILTVAGLLSVLNAYLLGMRRGVAAVACSMVSSPVVVLIALAYRAGPTSGFQIPNAVLLVLALGAGLSSLGLMLIAQNDGAEGAPPRA